MNIEEDSLFKYVVTSSKRFLQAVTDEKILDEGVTKQSIRAERFTRYRNKALHGQFLKGMEEVRDPDSWNWLKRGTIKKETEGLLTAAQDQIYELTASRIGSTKRMHVPAMCRLCGEREVTISHVTAECKKLAQKEYKMWRHDKVEQAIHWKLYQKFSLPSKDKWCCHAPERVMENNEVKVLWDFRVQTDHHHEHNRPDIVVLEKEERTCSVIDVAYSFDTRVLEKEQE